MLRSSCKFLHGCSLRRVLKLFLSIIEEFADLSVVAIEELRQLQSVVGIGPPFLGAPIIYSQRSFSCH
ncbi:hypothetical protein CDL15_Pgr000319 [Punica granatum]|uniref:Uncharacterized protein n=1 Tax=Punica granatum TaxID=22663 RepID=A0A218XUG8_PUNGR|nr:hypothetical protein CDL15_Pgr000319 [Punica granatum]